MASIMKRPLLSVGLAVALGLSASGQADSAVHLHPRFTDLTVRSDNNGNTHTFFMKGTDVDGNTYLMRKSAGRITRFEINGKPVREDQYEKYERLFADLDKPAPPVPPVTPVAPVAPVAPAAGMAPVPPAAPMAPAVAMTPAAPTAPVAPAAPAAPVMPAAPVPPVPPAEPQADKRIGRIIDDLVDKGIVDNDLELTFSLDNSALVVNGKTEPADVFTFFQKKYIKHARDHFDYSHKGGTTTINVSSDDDKN